MERDSPIEKLLQGAILQLHSYLYCCLFQKPVSKCFLAEPRYYKVTPQGLHVEIAADGSRQLARREEEELNESSISKPDASSSKPKIPCLWLLSIPT